VYCTLTPVTPLLLVHSGDDLYLSVAVLQCVLIVSCRQILQE